MKSAGQLSATAGRRVVLLGASNLTKGIDSVLAAAQMHWGGPLEVLTALGHGRSYGRDSRVLGRQLPGIIECGLWDGLAASPPGQTAALVTDIGNDLLYGYPVEMIAEWIDQCLDRMVALGARTVVTRLPLSSFDRLTPARFRLLRALLFPNSRMELAELERRAHQLDAHVTTAARRRGFTLVAHREVWYGIDPVHIRWRHRAAAWREILAPWSAPHGPSTPRRGSLTRLVYLRSRRPHYRRFWGREQRAAQPVARLADGTTVSIY